LDILIHYGHLAVDVIYGLTAGFDLPIVTVSAVSGQCLGGGFEGALTTDFLIADEDAKLGVPEISFNTFPGMGAVSLLARRIGLSLAEQVVSSGKVYSAAEMQDLGLVNVVATAGALRETTLDWLREGGEERWSKRRALIEARRRFSPLTHEELIRIVELWAECSHSITSQDLRHMERLAAAQKRIKSLSSEAA
jgi:DSF synthase